MLYSFLFLFPGVHIILIYLKIVNFWKFSLPCLCKKWFPQNYFFYLFLDRGREGEIEREKHQSVASCMCPDWGLNAQPRHVPQLRMEPSLCWRTPSQLSHTRQGCSGYFFLRFKKMIIYLFIFRERGREGEREGENH